MSTLRGIDGRPVTESALREAAATQACEARTLPASWWNQDVAERMSEWHRQNFPHPAVGARGSVRGAAGRGS